MVLDLYCPSCEAAFPMPKSCRAASVLNQMLLEGPWCAVGDGETPEDRVCAALSPTEAVECPACGHILELEESEVGQFTRELLGQW